jgi:hypothetical protein
VRHPRRRSSLEDRADLQRRRHSGAGSDGDGVAVADPVSTSITVPDARANTRTDVTAGPAVTNEPTDAGASRDVACPNDRTSTHAGAYPDAGAYSDPTADADGGNRWRLRFARLADDADVR